MLNSETLFTKNVSKMLNIYILTDGNERWFCFEILF